MSDEIIKPMIFFGTGFFFWFLSQRMYMRHYPLKRIESFDYGFIILSLVMASAFDSVVAPFIVSFINKSHKVIPSIRNYITGQPILFQVLIYLLLSDLLLYLAHRFLHTSVMWRFHVLHHSPVSLNWISGTRGSPIHYVLILTPEVITATLVPFSHNSWILAVVAIIGLLNQHLIHTNLQIPYAKQLETIFVTPRMHFVHHHPNLPYTNSNYGFVFSIWDRIFGTYVDADTVIEKGLLGIDYPSTKWGMFFGLKLKP